MAIVPDISYLISLSWAVEGIAIDSVAALEEAFFRMEARDLSSVVVRRAVDRWNTSSSSSSWLVTSDMTS